jgi:hypothetical protein
MGLAMLKHHPETWLKIGWQQLSSNHQEPSCCTEKQPQGTTSRSSDAAQGTSPAAPVLLPMQLRYLHD